MPAAGPQVSSNVAERGRRLVEEHHPELADRSVERPALESLRLHVGHAEVDVLEAGLLSPAPSEPAQRLRDVCTDHGSAGPTAFAAASEVLPPP